MKGSQLEPQAPQAMCNNHIAARERAPNRPSPSSFLLSPRACKHPAVFAICTTLHNVQRHQEKPLLRACGRGGQRPRASTPNRDTEQQTDIGPCEVDALGAGRRSRRRTLLSRAPDTLEPQAPPSQSRKTTGVTLRSAARLGQSPASEPAAQIYTHRAHEFEALDVHTLTKGLGADKAPLRPLRKSAARSCIRRIPECDRAHRSC